MPPPIIILTDFGHRDPFVGIMKGVISKIASQSPIIDLTHAIPPGDIQRGAITLLQALPYFPKGSVFLAVVDPGVGTHRKAIIVESQGYTFIGPDNGLFTFILDEDADGWELSNPDLALPNPSSTFHGRDIFAPAAAHSARGIPGNQFGQPVNKFSLITTPKLIYSGEDQLEGEIMHADQFGNALTSLGYFFLQKEGLYVFQPWIGDTKSFECHLTTSQVVLSGHTLPWAGNFAEIPDGNCAFIIGSSGLIEIAANRKSAYHLLGVKSGDPVKLLLSNETTKRKRP